MLKYLTFTGIDAHCDASELKKLQEEYSVVEFGVLTSKNNIGCKKRYPSLEKMQEFADSGLRMACHVCGGVARDAMRTGKFDEVQELLGPMFNVFQRFQYNINGCKCTSYFRYEGDVPIIIQAGTPDGETFYHCMNVLCRDGRIQGLMDSSGGRGVYSGDFDIVQDETKFVGYAGGLGVDNVKSAYLYLQRRLGDKPFWMDMESGVRDADDWFDISKARRVCEQVFGR